MPRAGIRSTSFSQPRSYPRQAGRYTVVRGTRSLFHGSDSKSAAPRPDDAEKVDTWVKYTELQAFGDMVSDFAGIYLPPYPGKKVPLDATTMAYYRVSSKADYKRIGKQVAEKKRVHSLTSTLTEAREDFQSKARLYVAIDFEQWEKGHSKILGMAWNGCPPIHAKMLIFSSEFGISQVEVQESSATSTQQDWQVKTRHILIAE